MELARRRDRVLEGPDDALQTRVSCERVLCGFQLALCCLSEVQRAFSVCARQYVHVDNAMCTHM